MNQTYQPPTIITFGNTKYSPAYVDWCDKTSDIPAEHSPQTINELTDGDIYNIGDAYYIVMPMVEEIDLWNTYGQELTADDWENEMQLTYYLEYGGARYYYDEIVKSIGREIHSESVECSVVATLIFENRDYEYLLCFKPNK